MNGENLFWITFWIGKKNILNNVAITCTWIVLDFKSSFIKKFKFDRLTHFVWCTKFISNIWYYSWLTIVIRKSVLWLIARAQRKMMVMHKFTEWTIRIIEKNIFSILSKDQAKQKFCKDEYLISKLRSKWITFIIEMLKIYVKLYQERPLICIIYP